MRESQVQTMEGAGVAVWFDRATDRLCMLDREDPRVQEARQTGSEVPSEAILRLDREDLEDFFEAVMTHAVAQTMVGGRGFRSVVDGALAVCDRNAAHWASLAEKIRSEVSQRSGGVAPAARDRAMVETSELTRLRQLEQDYKALQSDYERLRAQKDETDEERLGQDW